MIRIGLWRWPLALLLMAASGYGVYRWQGGFVKYYRATATVQTLDPAQLTRDLGRFQTERVRREVLSALGWIKPGANAQDVAKGSTKLAQVLQWQKREGHPTQAQLIGIGKDPAGIAWVVNATAKTSLLASANPTPWTVIHPAAVPQTPYRYDGWQKPLEAAGAAFLITLLLFGGRKKAAVQEHIHDVLREAAPPEPIKNELPIPEPEAPAPKQAEPIPLEIIKPLETEVAPPSVNPVTEKEPVTLDALYDRWKEVSTLFCGPSERWSAALIEKVGALVIETLEVVKADRGPLITKLAQHSAESGASLHVAHCALMVLAWALQEEYPEEDVHTLVWVALLHDAALSSLPWPDLLKAKPERCRDSAVPVLRWATASDALRHDVSAILGAMGGSQGLRPALTSEEERQRRLAQVMTRIDRQEKILRRHAVWLAHKHPMRKAM